MTEIAKVRYTHEAMIDLIIAEPEISQGKLAQHFGYTEGWTSQIISSDAFQEKLAARRKDVVNPALISTVEERFRALADRSLQVLQEKLAQPSFAVSDQLALKAAELGAKGLGAGGFGVAKPEPAAAPGMPHLELLAQNLLALQRRPAQIVDAEVVHVDAS